VILKNQLHHVFLISFAKVSLDTQKSYFP